MVIVRARLVEQHQVLSYYDTVLYSNSRVLYSAVKKWQTCHRVPRCWPHSTVCRSPGQVIGRPGLMVTSHCADRISGRWVTFLTLHNRSRSHFRFRKRMWRHSRWRTGAEMAPAPVMERWESYLHYLLRALLSSLCVCSNCDHLEITVSHKQSRLSCWPFSRWDWHISREQVK